MMKPRHAAALALAGWYLMVPPDSTVPHSVDLAAPISSWSIVTNFESADTCKQALTELQNRNDDPAKLDRTGRLRRFQKRQPADPELARARVDHASCVATGDPRLKEK
jgi:rRNA-processing protein FCF1